MLVPVNWLREFIEISDYDRVADELTAAGLEVEEIIDYRDKDKVFKTEVTPNRGDWLSVLGVAREIAAIKDQKITPPMPKEKDGLAIDNSGRISVKIQEKRDCPKYSARYLDKVQIRESSDKIKSRIESAGLRPINNVVDATNYVMLALGQPIHAFDKRKIKNNQIIVRRAYKNERIVLLNGQRLRLSDKDLVIADQEKPIALAGIMGALNSEVTSKTNRVIIESAWFDPKIIRATAKRYNLTTEASYRFERRVDPEINERASLLATQLIHESSPDLVSSRPITINHHLPAPKIKLNIERINEILGFNLSKREISNYLRRLGFRITGEIAEVPSWRGDISIIEDLAEEVARLYGYSRLPRKKLTKRSLDSSASSWIKKELLKDILSRLNLIEIKSHSFLSRDEAKILNLATRELVEVANPIDEDINYLRNSLMPGLLKSISKNPQESLIEIYELGNVFTKTKESAKLGIGLAGKKARTGKEIVKAFESSLGLKGLDWQIRAYSKKQLKKFKIKRPKVELIEIGLDQIIDKAKWLKKELEMMPKKGFQYQKVSKYPEVNRDLAFIVNQDLSPEKVKEEIEKLSDLIVRVELFDEYTSDKFGQDKKNIAFHLFFQSAKKTLTDKEVDKLVEKIISRIKRIFKAELRE